MAKTIDPQSRPGRMDRFCNDHPLLALLGLVLLAALASLLLLYQQQAAAVLYENF